jgi:hypothetical protein
MAVNANAQLSYYTAFSSQTFYKASTQADTSNTISVGGYPVVSLAFTTTGTDSAKVQIHTDGLVNGYWLLDVAPVRGLTLGRPTDTTLAGTAHTGQVLSVFLRDQGMAIDKLQNCAQIRLRNVFSSGAGDSVSATSYTEKIGLRKPN